MKLVEKLSVAPMMGYTDRHFRYLLRLISQCTVLYTEMVHTNSLLYGRTSQFLHYDFREKPVILQLGGSEANSLVKCIQLAQEYNYDAINLNVGCPSSRVQQGGFGACLMKEPQKTASCLKAMCESTELSITVKTRLGVDEFDNQAFLYRFVESQANAGVQQFIIHARKAWLKGLNPKQNRNIPPLDYERVYQLKKTFPQLHIGINGGVESLTEANEHLHWVDSVMIGRAAYRNPWLFAEADSKIFNKINTRIPSRAEIFTAYITYVKKELSEGTSWNRLIRPILSFFHGIPKARQWRSKLTATNNLRQKLSDLEELRAVLLSFE